MKVDEDGVEQMVEAPLDPLALTWGTAWEAGDFRRGCHAGFEKWLRVCQFACDTSKVLDLDFFSRADVQEFSRRACPPGFTSQSVCKPSGNGMEAL